MHNTLQQQLDSNHSIYSTWADPTGLTLKSICRTMVAPCHAVDHLSHG
jgi:hypothetical protein